MSHTLSKEMRKMNACVHSYWYSDIEAIETRNIEVTRALDNLMSALKTTEGLEVNIITAKALLEARDTLAKATATEDEPTA